MAVPHAMETPFALISALTELMAKGKDRMASRSVMLLARTLVSATAMVGLAAHAATECEQNYTATPATGGGTVHQSFVGLYGLDGNKAMASLKASAEKIHFQAVGDTKVAADGLMTTVVAQKATTAARGFPIVLMVSPKTDSAIIAFQLKEGVVAANAQGNICSFFDAADLKGQSANASAKKGTQNAVLALPLLARLNGGMTEEQAVADAVATAQANVAGVAAPAASPQANFARNPNDRGAAPDVADTRKVVTPKSTFNPSDVDANALSEGTSTISGFTCGLVAGQQQTTPNQPITLFPYSTYLKQSIDLIDANRYKGDKVRVDIDKRIFDTRIDGKTNFKGDFKFTRIKPGRYIIMAIFEGDATTTRAHPGASFEPATNTMYTWTDYEQVQTHAKSILQADVTVKQEGQVVDGVVVKPMGNGRFFVVLSSVCKWNRD